MAIEHGTQGRGPVFYNLIVPGTVSDRKIDKTGIHVRVTHPEKSGVVSGFMPVVQMDTVGMQSANLPRMGSQALVLYDPTGVEQGWILGSTYTTKDPPPQLAQDNPDSHLVLFDDGSYFLLNPDTKKWTINTQGECDVTTTGPIKIISTGNVEVTTQADLKATVTGNMTATVTGNATIQAQQITLQAPITIVTGILKVDTVQGNTAPFPTANPKMVNLDGSGNGS